MDNQAWQTMSPNLVDNQQQQVSSAPPVATVDVSFGVIIGQTFYKLVPVGVVPPVVEPAISKPKTKKAPARAGPDIRKPPNAFTLFMKEQRPVVMASAEGEDSATINTLLGQMWESLSLAEQLEYYIKSEQLSRIHAAMYPDWNNYRRRPKRKWCRAVSSQNHLRENHLSLNAPHLAVPAPVTPTGPNEDFVSTFFSRVGTDVTSALFGLVEAVEVQEVVADGRTSS
ncbi:transcription factor 7-like 1 isoform X2 [Syngnathoides biaculeatus]|uniref:transcription factor 7-like 1 isoform X2 n=1 Tax=Syngnathoides biaculeatus TaxID=300417 RepID=UPI002ADE2407|nr:transcription factor 7-like 1 isoform X2 [Syngnathoides biaculeatus]